VKARYPIYRSMIQEPRLGGVPRRFWLVEGGLVLVVLIMSGGGIVVCVCLGLALLTVHPVAVWLTSLDELWLEVAISALSFADEYDAGSPVGRKAPRPLRALRGRR
jgi:type IV secretory pathway TrbD component